MKRHILVMVSILMAFMSSKADFTIGLIPDTQKMVLSDTETKKFNANMKWYVDKSDSLKLAFVSHLGDIVDTKTGVTAEWQRAQTAMNILKADSMAYTMCQGNHDDIINFRKYFPVSDWEGKSYFGGIKALGGLENAFYLFKLDGMDFIVVVIETAYKTQLNPASWDWANQILTQYKDRRAIIVSHNINESGGSNIVNIAKNHDNVFLVLGGHSCIREHSWTEKNLAGTKTIHFFVQDYQCDDLKTTGANIRFYTFKPLENKVYAYTYSAWNDRWERDSNSEFSFAYDMTGAVVAVDDQIANSNPKMAIQYNRISNLITLSNGQEIRKVSIMSANGQLLMHKENNTTTAISTNNLPNGVYFVTIQKEDGENIAKNITKF